MTEAASHPNEADLRKSHDAMEWAQLLDFLAEVGSCAVPAHVHNLLPLFILEASAGSQVAARRSKPVLRFQMAYIGLPISLPEAACQSCPSKWHMAGFSSKHTSKCSLQVSTHKHHRHCSKPQAVLKDSTSLCQMHVAGPATNRGLTHCVLSSLCAGRLLQGGCDALDPAKWWLFTARR